MMGIVITSVCITQKSSAQAKISLNKPVIASSTESDNYPAANAVDANTTSIWSSGSSYKQFLYVDLGEVFDLTKVEITWGVGWRPIVFDIQYSLDAITWKTAATFKTETNTNDKQTFEGLKGKGKYVQFLGRGRGGKPGYRIADFSVYGNPAKK